MEGGVLSKDHAVSFLGIKMTLITKSIISIECPECHNLVFNWREDKEGELFCLKCWAEKIPEDPKRNTYDPIKHLFG